MRRMLSRILIGLFLWIFLSVPALAANLVNTIEYKLDNVVGGYGQGRRFERRNEIIRTH